LFIAIKPEVIENIRTVATLLSNLGKGKILFLFSQTLQTGSGAHRASYSMGTMDSAGAKAAGK
jgi:hypothetical protein